jgi:hypothetical protein
MGHPTTVADATIQVTMMVVGAFGSAWTWDNLGKIEGLVIATLTACLLVTNILLNIKKLRQKTGDTRPLFPRKLK